jgi:glycosyltransferase involved in cell wall biosynthesis
LRLALVITTYERPDALGAVLASTGRQRVAPAEIIVADDGSGPATRAVFDQHAAQARTPLRWVTQSHEGFRVARLRNLALASTQADYVVFIDGDMLLHPEFVADHARIARRGFFTQGVRVLADEILTSELISNPAMALTAASPGLGWLRRAYLLRAPALADAMRGVANHVISIKSCNQGYWRDDLERVNGFNEDFIGWGPEDKELSIRLENAGVRRQSLLFGGIAIHLRHAPASRAALPANLLLLEAARRERKVRCERGLADHSR